MVQVCEEGKRAPEESFGFRILARAITVKGSQVVKTGWVEMGTLVLKFLEFRVRAPIAPGISNI